MSNTTQYKRSRKNREGDPAALTSTKKDRRERRQKDYRNSWKAAQAEMEG